MLCLLCTTPALAGEVKVYTELTGRSALYREGRLTGYGVETVQEIMRRVGDTGGISVLPWARAYDILLQTPNTALISTTRTEARDPLFHWVGPLSRQQWVFIARKGSGIVINSLDDARKVGSIGTYIDDVRDKFLLGQGFTNLDRATSSVFNYRKLIHGRIDLVVSSIFGLEETAHQAGVSTSDLEIVHVLKEADLYLAFSHETAPKIVHAWQAAFKSMQDDGTFARIYRKWNPGQEVPLDVRRPWLNK